MSRCAPVKCTPSVGPIATLSLGLFLCLAGCGGSSTTGAGAVSGIGRGASAACDLVTADQATRILGRPTAAAAITAPGQADSACTWRVSGTAPGAPSFKVFLYRNAPAVQAFRTSLSAPVAPVARISVDGVPALWRPSTGADSGSAFVSAARGGSLMTVEASAGPAISDRVAKAAAALALRALRSEPS